MPPRYYNDNNDSVEPSSNPSDMVDLEHVETPPQPKGFPEPKPVGKLTDTSRMPFGKHKGLPMQDVPVSYLHWFWHQAESGHLNGVMVRDYIQRNIEALKDENTDLIWLKKP